MAGRVCVLEQHLWWMQHVMGAVHIIVDQAAGKEAGNGGEA